MIDRRKFLARIAAVVVAPPVLARIQPLDPLVQGVRWQSWPYGAKRPSEFAAGTIGIGFDEDTKPLSPLSHYLPRLDWYRKLYPDLVWEPVYRETGSSTFG